MDALQQHLFDSYRAARRGEPAPPPPGRYDRETLRTIREYRRLRAKPEPEFGPGPGFGSGSASGPRPPGRARLRTALTRWARRVRRARPPGGRLYCEDRA
ncbi:hypothetical protein ACIQAD_24235 [Streptomyces sp. NPDC088551]|uniref:hypothetical protein n=1 Tax=Streptomyces sp. NPDC088551 TaxID=3365863 RepID=UPI003821C379